MAFLKSSQKVISYNGTKWGDKVAERIAGSYTKTQKVFADKMNRTVGKINNTRLRLLVVLFCVIVGGYSSWLIVKAITFSPSQEKAIPIEPIKRPLNLGKTGDENVAGDVYVDEYTFRQIQYFKRYMDSLHSANPRLHDSVLTARPLLKDSLTALERLYQLQIHK